EPETGGETPPPVASTCSGLEGPLDVVQCTLSEQLFGALIGGASAVPEQLPLAQLLTCVDNTVSTRALDLIDALAASADPSSLTDPANAPLVAAVTDLLGSVGGLLLSAAGQNGGSCQLDLAGGGLPGGGAGIPGADGIPGLDQLMALLGGAGGGDTPLDPSQLAAISDGLQLLSEQLRNASGPAEAAPLVPEVLELVADLIDDLGQVLSDPTAAPDSLQFLATNLAANLQAIPASLLGLGGAPSLPGGGGSDGNPLAGIPVLGDIIGTILAAGGGLGGAPSEGDNNPLAGTPLAPLGALLAPLFALSPF
ncbi:MAG: hypothetical protein Q8K94_03510, partial [Moraxellaceae bacterium]|nr:hypothetical protein [Moraxellaceae bacterium]